MRGLVVDIIHTSNHFFSSEDPLLVYLIHPVYWILLSDLSPPLRFLTHFMWGAHFRAVTLNILNRYLSILPAISLGISPARPPPYKMTVNREWKLNIMHHFFVHNFPEWTWPNEIATMLKGGFFFFFLNFIIISTWSDHSCCEKKVPHNKLEQIRS